MNQITVTVKCTVDADGNINPRNIRWKDGRVWSIERVLHTCRSPDLSFEGIRYAVLIRGEEKYLYKTRNRWYVNASV